MPVGRRTALHTAQRSGALVSSPPPPWVRSTHDRHRSPSPGRPRTTNRRTTSLDPPRPTPTQPSRRACAPRSGRRAMRRSASSSRTSTWPRPKLRSSAARSPRSPASSARRSRSSSFAVLLLIIGTSLFLGRMAARFDGLGRPPRVLLFSSRSPSRASWSSVSVPAGARPALLLGVLIGILVAFVAALTLPNQLYATSATPRPWPSTRASGRSSSACSSGRVVGLLVGDRPGDPDARQRRRSRSARLLGLTLRRRSVGAFTAITFGGPGRDRPRHRRRLRRLDRAHARCDVARTGIDVEALKDRFYPAPDDRDQQGDARVATDPADAARERVLAARAELGERARGPRGVRSRRGRHPGQDQAQPGQGRGRRRWRRLPRAQGSAAGLRRRPAGGRRQRRRRCPRRCCPTRSRRPCASSARTATRSAARSSATSPTTPRRRRHGATACARSSCSASSGRSLPTRRRARRQTSLFTPEQGGLRRPTRAASASGSGAGEPPPHAGARPDGRATPDRCRHRPRRGRRRG